MKRKEKKVTVREININVFNKADVKVMERAMEILELQGFTICKKSDLVLESQI